MVGSNTVTRPGLYTAEQTDTPDTDGLKRRRTSVNDRADVIVYKQLEVDH